MSQGATTERLHRFREAMEANRFDEALAQEQRTRKAERLAHQLVAELGDDALEAINFIGRSNAFALHVTGEALISACARGFSEDPGAARLGFIPVFFHGPDRRPFRPTRQLQLTAPPPPLSNGSPLPPLWGLGLTLEEAIQPQVCRALHHALSHGEAIRLPPEVASGTDFEGRAGFQTLRLVPFLHRDRDLPEMTQMQKEEWREAAWRNPFLQTPVDIRVNALAPYPYDVALAVAESAGIFQPALEAVLGAPPYDSGGSVLIEPFGSQTSGVASHFRLSTAAGRTQVVTVILPSERASARFMGQKLAQLARDLGATGQVAPLVQDLELLVRGGPRRVCFVLGKCRVFQEEWPDGLPLHSANDPAFERYWTYERGVATEDAELMRAKLATMLNLPDGAIRSYGSMGLHSGVWRPHLLVEVTEAGEGQAPWPPEKSVLDMIAQFGAFTSGREWCRWLLMGGES